MTPLSERYFRPKAIEIDGRIFEWLGVVRFKRLLMGLLTVDAGRRRESAYVLSGRSLDDVRAFERRSRRSEVVHGLWLVVAVVFLVFGLWVRSLFVAGLVVLAANLHCFLLQRYNRVRVYRVLNRRASKSGAGDDRARLGDTRGGGRK